MTVASPLFHYSLHLGEGDMLLPDKHCRFCGAANLKKASILQQSPDVYLLECLNCFSFGASRLPTKKTLDEYYDKYYQATENSRKNISKVTFDQNRRFGQYLAKRMLKINKDKIDQSNSIRILDFGGGDGSLVIEVASQILKYKRIKIVVDLVDYNKDVALIKDKNISLSRYDIIQDVVENKYDFVIASAVLEHIPEPREVLLNLLSVIEEKGGFYARTPSIQPFMKYFNVFGLQLFDFTFPGHIYDLGQKFWESILDNITAKDTFSIIESSPSIVETSFNKHFFRTMLAYSLKSPWYVLGEKYKFVGGWEVFLQKK